MDKENLYYLVNPGTNEKVIVHGIAFIGNKDGAENRKDKYNKNHEIISIKDYENIFMYDDK